MTVTTVELIGNPRAGSRTRTLADAVVTELASHLERAGNPLSRPTVLDLAELVGVSFGPAAARPDAPVDDPFAPVRAARLLVVATPAYKGTYTGLLKIFLDQLGPGDLAGVIALPVAVAGAPAHADRTATSLRDLLSELGAEATIPPLTALESRLAAPVEAAAEWVAAHAGQLGELLARTPARGNLRLHHSR
ncbi:hypothetical protein CA850_23625 [Micromonospora echinospora]|uniref:FMN reductase n=1 Tax=Micromonospora echinospora TaxID=1877 RepID=A0A1C4YUH2_MICEC|nr:NAD(P)H-dependent oxidoreductase [Micromonospora echinospora]OZV77427.1 hypothetical protein CA850_23625 [Micromonospora echinospora]SCF24306.1 FMN reductase [Micromonospora echinospora]